MMRWHTVFVYQEVHLNFILTKFFNITNIYYMGKSALIVRNKFRQYLRKYSNVYPCDIN